MILLCLLIIAAAVVYAVSAPLRKAGAQAKASSSGKGVQVQVRRDDLEAARDAKYKEIRDAELDYRTGKLSQDDYTKLDAELRAEAVEILARLDELGRGPDSDGL